MHRIFTPTPRTNDWGNTVYPLWSADGMVPPPYMGNTFDGTHTHYLATGTTTLDSTHIEQLCVHVQEHGYGVRSATAMLILLNDVDFEASRISAWRAGVEYRAGSSLPKWDFIPSTLLPAWISAEEIHGPTPPDKYNNLDVWGSYGGALVIKSPYIPRGYVAVVATGGPNSDINAVGFREHISLDYQGLRHIQRDGPYPLQDSFYIRSFASGPGPVAPHLNGRPPAEGGIYMPKAPRVDPPPSGVGEPRRYRRPPNEARGYPGRRVTRKPTKRGRGGTTWRCPAENARPDCRHREE
jgi:hypothetical protein